jgi:hypothetical protein
MAWSYLLCIYRMRRKRTEIKIDDDLEQKKKVDREQNLVSLFEWYMRKKKFFCSLLSATTT